MSESVVARQAYADLLRLRERRLPRHGARAGLEAGVVVAVVAAILGAIEGSGPGYAAKLIAGVWYGTPALISGADGVLVGLATHLALSAALGAAFVSWARPTLARGSVWIAGLTFGAAVWLTATFALMPLLDSVMRLRLALVPGTWLCLNLLFGLCLAARARADCVPTGRPAIPDAGSAEGSSAER